MSGVLDRDLAPEIVVQGVVEIIGESEEDVDTGALDIGIDNSDAMAHGRQLPREVRGRIALAGAATEGVDGNNGGHGGLLDYCRALSLNSPARYTTQESLRKVPGRPRPAARLEPEQR